MEFNLLIFLIYIIYNEKKYIYNFCREYFYKKLGLLFFNLD